MVRADRRALVLYGVATFLAFPHEIPLPGGLAGLTSIDLGLLLAWLVPAALIVGIAGLEPRRAARTAFWASLAAHSVFFYWFVVVTLVYGGMPIALGVLAPLVPALYVSIFTALFAWAWARSAPRSAWAIPFGAALWVAVDLVRGRIFGGFPWASLGYALHLDGPLLFWTRFGGYFALTFAAVAVGVAVAQARLDPGRRTRLRLLATVAGVLALHLLGGWPGGRDAPEAEGSTIRVAAIQGNIDQGEKWESERRARILATYLRLSEMAARSDPALDWIVWPETAVPGLVENDPGLRAQLGLLARRHDVTLVVGGMGVELDEEARRFSAFFDSAFQLDPDGALRDRYDKTHLVPFGEFVPLRGLLGHFFQSLATGLSTTDVTPGPAPRNLRLVAPDRADDRVPVGVPICYELLFPHLVREFAGQGAGALLAITNDAWYGRTGAPHQFLAMTAMRAAENGLPTVRAANTGISAIIDAQGRVTQASPLFEEAIVVGEIVVARAETPATFYARFGDVFAWCCAVVSLVGLIGSGRGSRSRPSRNPVATSASQA